MRSSRNIHAIEPKRATAEIHSFFCACRDCSSLSGRAAIERDVNAVLIGFTLALGAFPVLVVIRLWPQISAAVAALLS